MILTDLQKAVAKLHNDDAFFSASPACVVLWDGQKEEEEKTLKATGRAIAQVARSDSSLRPPPQTNRQRSDPSSFAACD